MCIIKARSGAFGLGYVTPYFLANWLLHGLLYGLNIACMKAGDVAGLFGINDN
jgi:hypothetical protein